MVGPNGEEFDSTAGGTDEMIDISNPANGTWKVYVHGWSTPGGDSDYDMWSWAIPERRVAARCRSYRLPTSATNATIGTVEPAGAGSPRAPPATGTWARCPTPGRAA